MAYYIHGLILWYPHFSWGTSHKAYDVQNRAHLVILKDYISEIFGENGNKIEEILYSSLFISNP